MCTLSFIPKSDGFLVGMNRDELLSRGAAQPPSLHDIRGTTTVFPLDVEGGTWIAATEPGNCFALLNRNGGDPRLKRRSRGELVTLVLASSGCREVESALDQIDLTQYLPFRLVGFFGSAMQAFEWTWDGQRLATIAHGWEPRHWYSSGVSDEQATISRARIFEAAAKDPDAGSSEWLRRIHRSHKDKAGAFSVCVHRDDAASLSYTEVLVSRSHIAMSYRPGSPCEDASTSEIAVPRLKAISSL